MREIEKEAAVGTEKSNRERERKESKEVKYILGMKQEP